MHSSIGVRDSARRKSCRREMKEGVFGRKYLEHGTLSRIRCSSEMSLRYQFTMNSFLSMALDLLCPSHISIALKPTAARARSTDTQKRRAFLFSAFTTPAAATRSNSKDPPRATVKLQTERPNSSSSTPAKSTRPNPRNREHPAPPPPPSPAIPPNATNRPPPRSTQRGNSHPHNNSGYHPYTHPPHSYESGTP